MLKSTARKPMGKGGKQYHINCQPGDLASYLLMPGDPDRVEKITKDWKNKKQLGIKREYRSVTGTFENVKMSCLSTGLGAPSLAIALEEAARLKVNTFIRVGSTGTIKKEINLGDLIINVAGVRLEGTSQQYVRSEYPAFANYEVVLALIEACEKMKYKYHLGITASTDAFYVGEGRKGFQGYFQSHSHNLLPDLQRAGVINMEMESSVLFTLGNLYGLRTGAICAVFDNLITNKWAVKGEEQAGRAASEAIAILNQWDKAKKKNKKKYFYPSLIK